MEFLNREEIKAKYGLPVTLLKKHLKAEDEYFSEQKIRQIIDDLMKQGWKPGTKKCFDCGEFKNLREFRPMDYCCKVCRSKRGEGHHARSKTLL